MTNQINNQSIIPSTDVIEVTLTVKMTTAQVVETSVTVNNNSPIQDYVHLDDQTQPTFGIVCMLWVNFILGLSFIFLCLKLSHTLPYPKGLVVLLSFRLIFNRIIKLGIRRSIALKALWSK